MIRQFFSLSGLLLAACSTFSPATKIGLATLTVNEMQNGFLVEIRTENPVSDVAITLPGSRWLIITVPDTLLDTSAIAVYRSREVDSTEVHRFETATQFAIRLKKPISSAEVIPPSGRKNILISVFF
ncbi:MAG: hypothetical protein WEB37_09805 [Bacteroidota bacterium]